jgi:hypothetical protein
MPRQNVAASVYGTVLVSSVIVGLDEAEESTGSMIAIVVVTGVVFALAHGWSNAIGRSAELGQPLRLEVLKQSITQEWPMAQAVGPSVVALVLAGVGVYSTNTGLWAAIIANIVLLFAWGAVLSELANGTPVQIVVGGLETSTLGLVLVALKALVH